MTTPGSIISSLTLGIYRFLQPAIATTHAAINMTANTAVIRFIVSTLLSSPRGEKSKIPISVYLR
jgi:hypothetical protein